MGVRGSTTFSSCMHSEWGGVVVLLSPKSSSITIVALAQVHLLRLCVIFTTSYLLQHCRVRCRHVSSRRLPVMPAVCRERVLDARHDIVNITLLRSPSDIAIFYCYLAATTIMPGFMPTCHQTMPTITMSVCAQDDYRRVLPVH